MNVSFHTLHWDNVDKRILDSHKKVFNHLDIIQDPIFDFVPGTQIFIPKRSGLVSILGI